MIKLSVFSWPDARAPGESLALQEHPDSSCQFDFGLPLLKYLISPENLQATHKKQDEQDDNNQAQPPTWVVSPSAAIWPRWQRTYEQQNQNY